MSYLSNSRRCKLFEEIANNTWKHVIRNHSTGVQVSEVGKTNDIVAEIRASHLADNNIGVWANPGHLEIENGSDLDIFVETKVGMFVWWALQAKVLKRDGTYKGLTTLHGREYQWDKLRRLSEQTGCFSRYLLYNGLADFRMYMDDQCNRRFDEDQYGCSLVRLDDMEAIALDRVPRFRDFHPIYAEPWRIIPCCYINPSRLKTQTYSLAQIQDSVKYYEAAKGNPELFETGETMIDPKGNDIAIDAINKFSEEHGREPIARMVLRSTAALGAR